MKITHDKEADAMLIRLNDKAFARNQFINENFILKLDAEGNVIAVEILWASEQVMNPTQVDFEDITRKVDTTAK